MFKQTLKEIYKEVAKEHGLTETEVEEIVSAQFLFVRETMREGEKNKPDTFKAIQLTHLGKFAIRKHKLEEFKKKANGQE
jgi:nucleoid DNA-binding protein